MYPIIIDGISSAKLAETTWSPYGDPRPLSTQDGRYMPKPPSHRQGRRHAKSTGWWEAADRHCAHLIYWQPCTKNEENEAFDSSLELYAAAHFAPIDADVLRDIG